MASSLYYHHHHHHHPHTFLSPPNPTPTKSIPRLPPPSSATALPHRHLKATRSSSRNSSERSLLDAFAALNAPSDAYPNRPEAFASTLDLCASHRALPQGRQIHARAVTSGSISHDDGFLQSKLLFVYGKCGSLHDARKLFDEMPRRNIFAWNAMIGAYISSGWYLDALELYGELRRSGFHPDTRTFASLLRACATVQDVNFGKEVHGLGIKSGALSSIFVANALIAMYAKCGLRDHARRLFDSLPEKSDTVSWNSVMSACLQVGDFFEVLELFREMQETRIPMNSYTVVGILQACSELYSLKFGREVHAALLKLNRRFEIFEANALLVMYACCGRVDKASLVFKEMAERDNVLWNSMLSAYVWNDCYEEAVKFFIGIHDKGFKPDQVSVISMASALGRLGNVLGGKELHAYALKGGFHLEVQVGNTIMDMYMKCCCIGYAERVFGRMPQRDFVSWTMALAGYAQKGCYLEAVELFGEVQREGMKVDALMVGSILPACRGLSSCSYLKQIHGYAIRHDLLDLMLKNSIVDLYGEFGEVSYASRVFEGTWNKDVVSWTSLMNCYVENGLLNEAIEVFCEMEEANVQYDAVALNSILAAASELSSQRIGKEIHGFLARKGFDKDGSVMVALADMYAKCGNLASCLTIADTVTQKDLRLWTTVINACGMHGQGKEAIRRFRSLMYSGLLPDHVAFLSILYACVHSGLVDEGTWFLDVMRNDYKLEPWPQHHACMVDLLGRSGNINEAYEYIRRMPTKATSAAWCALLAACRVHSNNEIGEVAARALLELEPVNPGNYVLVSNTFAASSKWEEVDEVRMRMREMGLRKDPACSWIEVGNKVHSFIARDTSHPETKRIYAKLDEIRDLLEKHAGYVGDTRFVLHNVEEEEKLNLLYRHSERLAIAYGLISTPEKAPIRITKNLRVCGDCHEFTKHVSRLFGREFIVRDANRFHHFKAGSCSCGDFW